MIENRTVKNAAWIIGCRIIQAVLGLIVTMLSARYLGPSGYGLLNYAASLVSFFVPVMQLGLNGTLVQELIADPEHEGEVMGTAIFLTMLSGMSCIIGIGAFSALVNRSEPQTIYICVLYSLLLVFQGMEMIQYWFQAKLLSQYTSITILVAYIMIAAYRIMLLITGCSIYWYAVSQALDFAIIAIVLLVIFHRISGKKLTVSRSRAAEMLSRSRYYIISGMMITVFAQTDRVMLKLMVNEEAVGYYSAAASCTSLTTFVFVAIIDSARPAILEGKKQSQEVFHQRMKLLYAVIICFALLQSAVISIFSGLAVDILYGPAYSAAVDTLRILVWYTTFSYLGAVRDIWILAENLQKYLWVINLSGAAANVAMNALLIPVYGVNGAAVASLLTQIFTNVIMGWIVKPIRPTNRLMLQSLHPGFLISQWKQIKNSHKSME